MEFAAHTYIRIEHNAASLCVDVGPCASVLAATAFINTCSTTLRDAIPSPAEDDDAGSCFQRGKSRCAFAYVCQSDFLDNFFAGVFHCGLSRSYLCARVTNETRLDFPHVSYRTSSCRSRRAPPHSARSFLTLLCQLLTFPSTSFKNYTF